MLPWSEAIDPVADQNEFAGVVSVHRGGQPEFARAYGLADRANEDYLAVLGGHPAKFPAGERFSYCNGGYAALPSTSSWPDACAGQRGRRDLLDGRRHQRRVAVAVRGEDRAGPVGDRNGPAPACTTWDRLSPAP
jgi:hypothetical protein